MKIAVPAWQPDPGSGVDARFGKANYLLFLNEDGEVRQTVTDPGGDASRGAGVGAAQEILSQGADVLIVSQIGPNALEILEGTGVEIYSAGSARSVKQALSLWKQGKLKKATAS